MKAHILIAEDEAGIRAGLRATLESEGYTVTAAPNGAQAVKLFSAEMHDLVILDVMMPQLSGYDVCRELRAHGATTPVLFLTAKSEEIDKVVGLKLGADDYVTKPFGVQELLARVEALLRRGREGNRSAGAKRDATGAAERPAVFQLGAAEIDRRKFTATVARRVTSLTSRELKLLEIFADRPGEVLTRDALLSAVWGTGYFGTTRTLDQHMAQLRKKIESDPEHPTTIVTVHGVGYRHEI
jgi:DNA-binding response OmpR family regulator